LKAESKELENLEARINERLQLICHKMKDENQVKAFTVEMEGFKDLIGRYLKTRKDIYVNWDKIKPPPEEMV
jgi:UDP-N-acetylglucosamine pyrophosphorylase